MLEKEEKSVALRLERRRGKDVCSLCPTKEKRIRGSGSHPQNKRKQWISKILCKRGGKNGIKDRSRS